MNLLSRNQKVDDVAKDLADKVEDLVVVQKVEEVADKVELANNVELSVDKVEPDVEIIEDIANNVELLHS